MSFLKQEEWWKGKFGSYEDRMLYQIKENTEREQRQSSRELDRFIEKHSGPAPEKTTFDHALIWILKFISGFLIGLVLMELFVL